MPRANDRAHGPVRLSGRTGKTAGTRERGRRLFDAIARSEPRNDDALRRPLDDAALEWREADIRKCPAAMAHLATVAKLRFYLAIEFTPRLPTIVLHADTVSIEIGEYAERSRYAGWLRPGSPAEWADRFAKSLGRCWKPSVAPAPWRAPDQ